MVVSGDAALLPSFTYAYIEYGPSIKSKGKRACADMERIYAATGNCDRNLALITAALAAIAATLFIHTSELQSGGRFAGENPTLELRARYSGVNVTNPPRWSERSASRSSSTPAREAAICAGAGGACCSSTTTRTCGASS